MQKRPKISFELILVLIVLVIHISMAVRPPNSVMNWFIADDVFYYFKTAQNIAAGSGVTFDGIAQSNGFHPLWMLICIPVFALANTTNLILPLRIIMLVLGLFSAGTGVFLYRLLKKVTSREIAAVVSLVWVLSPTVHATVTRLGLETGVNAFFIVLLLYLFANWEERQRQGQPGTWKQVLWLGLVAVLTLYSRLDNSFLVCIVGAWIVLRSSSIDRSLFVGELLSTGLAVFLAFVLRLGLGNAYYQMVSAMILMLVAAMAIRALFHYLFGLYNRSFLHQASVKNIVLRIAVSTAAGTAAITVLVMALIRMGRLTSFPRSALLIEFILSLIFAAALRFIVRKWGVQPAAAEPAVSGYGLKQVLQFNELRLENWKLFFTRFAAYFLPLGAALGAYMAYNHAKFGTSTPVSGQIKRWWGTIYTVYGRPKSDLWGVLGFDKNGSWRIITDPIYELAKTMAENRGLESGSSLYSGIVVAGIVLILAFALAILALNRKYTASAWKGLGLMPLWAGSMIQMANYTMTGYVAAKAWYWVGQMLFATLILAIMAEIVWRKLQATKLDKRILQALPAIISVILVVGYVNYSMELVPPTVSPENEEVYLGGAHGLETYTEPGSLIGSTGGGVLGYFTQGRTIVNLDGLINSYDYYLLMQEGRASEYLDEIGLDYLYGARYVLEESEPYFNTFHGRTEYIGEVVGSALMHYLPEDQAQP
ncbi:MAG: hypothetical protein K8R77_00555 [Anaerolineaceae bacterium]|nr:hypothetical protein [Anaerolineaceae bacterium]